MAWSGSILLHTRSNTSPSDYFFFRAYKCQLSIACLENQLSKFCCGCFCYVVLLFAAVKFCYLHCMFRNSILCKNFIKTAVAVSVQLNYSLLQSKFTFLKKVIDIICNCFVWQSTCYISLRHPHFVICFLKHINVSFRLHVWRCNYLNVCIFLRRVLLCCSFATVKLCCLFSIFY